jgi:hypothetical protein
MGRRLALKRSNHGLGIDEVSFAIGAACPTAWAFHNFRLHRSIPLLAHLDGIHLFVNGTLCMLGGRFSFVCRGVESVDVVTWRLQHVLEHRA